MSGIYPAYDLLISAPPAAKKYHELLKTPRGAHAFFGSDPEGVRLGSGGGTAYLLIEAWKNANSTLTFKEWLHSGIKIAVNGGGQSRRLPSYSAIGKPFIPMPALKSSYGQSFEQTLLDLQIHDYLRIVENAPTDYVLMIASGDVLLQYGSRLPNLPKADILAMGMYLEPEDAEGFGVFFLNKDKQGSLDFFLQKPKAPATRAYSSTHNYLVDTGLWLLSEKAVMTLLKKCGWDEEKQEFINGVPSEYELYAKLGLALGANPSERDPELAQLSSEVYALPNPRFYHMGTSRQLIESVTILQNRGDGSSWTGQAFPNRIVLNSAFDAPSQRTSNDMLWIENACVPPSWRLSSNHVLTGVPDNNWDLALENGVCIDFVPVGDSKYCIRFYGFDDSFSGAIGSAGTKWFGAPAPKWFTLRGIDLSEAGISPDTDIQYAPIFPVIDINAIRGHFIEWLFQESPRDVQEWVDLWLKLDRLSAFELMNQANLERLLTQQKGFRNHALTRVCAKQERSMFYRLDLENIADTAVKDKLILPDEEPPENSTPMTRVHYNMFRSALARHHGLPDWENDEKKAFGVLRQAIVEQAGLALSEPSAHVMKDQIIWGRSPARLDLAGGWTDTPPFCLERGGRVVNVAVNLNGQPPVQVFARLSPKNEIVIRSIDLGVEQRVTSYEQIAEYAKPGSEFSLAKAALAMAGFYPPFHRGGGFVSLEEQLKSFGGGIELSLLAAMPAGSGLGTSSILAATLLGVLSELCGLGWDKHEIIARTLAVEQMLTTGGGWQDQVGGIFAGMKLSETAPGLVQKPTIRWLPNTLFGTGYANETALLYYTGLTRMARYILQEIVRGMFVNEQERLIILERMREHALDTFDAIQRNDWEGLMEAVRVSWVLNQRLDSGTNPPGVAEILNRVAKYPATAKLLGAGGGGYLLIMAKDRDAGLSIKKELTENPPNDRARFVEVSISQTGLEITRS